MYITNFQEQQLAGVTDEAEAEPFMGSGRFGKRSQSIFFLL